MSYELVEKICIWCNGSGEGMVDGTSCTTCNGSGVEWVEEFVDESEDTD